MEEPQAPRRLGGAGAPEDQAAAGEAAIVLPGVDRATGAGKACSVISNHEGGARVLSPAIGTRSLWERL